MCLQLIYYLTQIKEINWQDSCNSLFKMGYNDCYGIVIELNLQLIQWYNFIIDIRAVYMAANVDPDRLASL